jgi:hypothetical protein
MPDLSYLKHVISMLTVLCYDQHRSTSLIPSHCEDLMKANVHEFIVFLVSISSCSLRKPMFIDKSDCHQCWPMETSAETP